MNSLSLIRWWDDTTKPRELVLLLDRTQSLAWTIFRILFRLATEAQFGQVVSGLLVLTDETREALGAVLGRALEATEAVGYDDRERIYQAAAQPSLLIVDSLSRWNANRLQPPLRDPRSVVVFLLRDVDTSGYLTLQVQSILQFFPRITPLLVDDAARIQLNYTFDNVAMTPAQDEEYRRRLAARREGISRVATRDPIELLEAADMTYPAALQTQYNIPREERDYVPPDRSVAEGGWMDPTHVQQNVLLFPKLVYTIRLMQEQPGQYAVWSRFLNHHGALFVDEILRAYGYTVTLITGRTTEAQRLRAIRELNLAWHAGRPNHVLLFTTDKLSAPPFNVTQVVYLDPPSVETLNDNLQWMANFDYNRHTQITLRFLLASRTASSSLLPVQVDGAETVNHTLYNSLVRELQRIQEIRDAVRERAGRLVFARHHAVVVW